MLSIGADKRAYFWDKDSKQKLFTTPNTSRECGVGKFNRDGTLFAYVAQYDYSQGKYGKNMYQLNLVPRVAMFIHKPTPEQIDNRGKFSIQILLNLNSIIVGPFYKDHTRIRDFIL